LDRGKTVPTWLRKVITLQLTNVRGNSLGVCTSAITGGSSYGKAVVLGTNFLRAYYTVYSTEGGEGNATVRPPYHPPTSERLVSTFLPEQSHF